MTYDISVNAVTGDTNTWVKYGGSSISSGAAVFNKTLQITPLSDP